MTPLGVGIIGFGRIGMEHARWITQAAGVTVAAVADPTPARLDKARAQGLASFDSIGELLEHPGVDVVLVSTPTAFHYEHASAALHAGKHVMVEKPFALTLQQARELTMLARQGGRRLCVFHNRRWDIDFLTVRRHVREGTFGKIINVESRLGQFASCVGPAALEYRPNWRNEQAFGGGGLYDWGSHFVDQLWRLMLPARPTHLFAQLRSNVWSADCDDFARIVINFDNGATGLCEINTTTTQPLPRWHINGTRGSATSPASPEFDTAEWAKLTFTPSPSKETIEPAVLSLAPPGLSEPQIWSRFADAIQNGQPAPIEPESVLPTMALLDAARQSSAENRSIDLRDVEFPPDRGG